MKLFLSKELKTDDKETAILAVLNGMCSNKHDYLATSVSLIGYEMTGRFLKTYDKRERNIVVSIRDAINSLTEKGIITILDQNDDDYVFAKDGLDVDTEKDKFVVVEQSEMQRIFENANKPFNVFSFFCCLVGTINNKTKEWHMSQDDMAEQWNYSKRTINSYIEQLEDMKLIYVYRHNKRRADGTYYKLNNSYGRYADKDAIIMAAQEYADTVECEDFCEKIDRRAIKLRYNAYCNNAKKYKNNPSAELYLYNECKAYNKSLKYKPVEGNYEGEWKQGEPLDLSVFPDYVRKDGQKVSDETGDWGEPDSMLHNFSVEEMLDMPTMGEVQMNPTKCEGQSEPSKKVSVTDSDLHSEDSLNLTKGSQKSSTTDDLDLIDIESLFDEDTDDRPILSQEEAWELFA